MLTGYELGVMDVHEVMLQPVLVTVILAVGVGLGPMLLLNALDEVLPPAWSLSTTIPPFTETKQQWWVGVTTLSFQRRRTMWALAYSFFSLSTSMRSTYAATRSGGQQSQTHHKTRVGGEDRRRGEKTGRAKTHLFRQRALVFSI